MIQRANRDIFQMKFGILTDKLQSAENSKIDQTHKERRAWSHEKSLTGFPGMWWREQVPPGHSVVLICVQSSSTWTWPLCQLWSSLPSSAGALPQELLQVWGLVATVVWLQPEVQLATWLGAERRHRVGAEEVLRAATSRGNSEPFFSHGFFPLFVAEIPFLVVFILAIE